ncbi:MAG: hypothetical protein LBL94_08995 [Prevotellaceae bacterium]|jgi:hypothetical protein|nr:hypothetical protein [Prevotellaceae bacterium]
MLTDKQQKVLEVNRVGAVQLQNGEWVFTICGRIAPQKPSISQENALKKAIGYIFSNR